MVRHTSLVVLGLGAFGSALAQQSIIVGFSDEAGLEAVRKRVNHPGVGIFAGGLGAHKEPTMFRRPLKVARKAKGSGPDRPGPETEMTIGFLRVDFTDEDGLPIYGNNTDIEKEIDALNLLPGVTVAELDGEVKALGFPTNGMEGKKNKSSSLRGQMERVLAESTPWGIRIVNITQFWEGGSQEVTPQSDVTICVIDTGYDLGHEDLPDTIDGVTGFTPPGQDGGFGVWDVDGHSHGTHVAGTIGAIGSNNIGVVGVNPDPTKFKFHISKGLSDNGSGSYAGIIDCIEDCVAKGAKVISMSLGGSGSSSLMESACEAAYDDGVLVIAAAGNSGSTDYLYPASYPVVMSVASVAYGGGPESDTYGELSYFSTRNDQVEIAGPGSSVYSTVPNDGYGTKSGTSMATPHVSGVAAWLISLFPNCNANQIRNAMLNSVREPPRDADGWDKLYGHGIVDAGAAYSLLSSAGCVGAGGLSPSDAGEAPREMGQGGTYQKDIGCTADHHCYIGASFGPRFCNIDLSPNRCAPGTAPPPSPTASPHPTPLVLGYCSDDSTQRCVVGGDLSECGCGGATRKLRTLQGCATEGVETTACGASRGPGVSKKPCCQNMECSSTGNFCVMSTNPTKVPTNGPTANPTTLNPTTQPTTFVCDCLTNSVTEKPTNIPTKNPTPPPTSPPTSQCLQRNQKCGRDIPGTCCNGTCRGKDGGSCN